MASTESAMVRFQRLPIPSFEKIYADANTILDDIISQCHSFNTSSHNTDSKEMVAFITHGCKILQNATILLRSKFAQVINIYLPLIKSSIDYECINNLVSFLCQSMSNSKSTLVLEFIKALAAALAGNGSQLSEESIIQLLSDEGVLWFYLSQKDDIVKSYSIQSLGNMCIRASDGEVIDKTYMRLCYAKVLDYLRLLLIDKLDDLDHLKIIIVALKSLQNILESITVNDGIVEAEFAVSLIKIFLSYGAPDYNIVVEKMLRILPTRNLDDITLVEKIYPTKRKEKSPMTKKVHAKKLRKKKKKNTQVNIEEEFESATDDCFGVSIHKNWRQPVALSSSESDYSDSECAKKETLSLVMIKIQVHAAYIIQNILRCCDRRSKFSCWLTLVPDIISTSHPSILYSLAMVHQQKVRASVLLALMELIDGSRGFLESAVSNARAASYPFTSFSVKLSQSLHLLHETLLTVLEQEKTDAGKDKIVKCLTLLILNAPYKKLGVDYLPNVITAVHILLQSSDCNLCQTTLTCIAACISVQPTNEHVLEILQQSALPQKFQMTRNSNNLEIKEESSWLVIFCLQILLAASKDAVRELRLAAECIQLLTVILRCHPQLLKKHQCKIIVDLNVNLFLFSTDVLISLHSIKILEEFSKYYLKLFEKSHDSTECVSYWKSMLTGPIPQYLHVKPVKPVKGQAAVCDWLSNVGSDIFFALKNPEQIFVKTVLIGLANSEEPVIVAAAVRGLGVIIDYESMKEDIWFVMDVSRVVILQLDNPSVNVRLKAAWSLANLCDFISKNNYLLREFPDSLIQDILKYSTQASLDNEKVSCNGVRALGNILNALPQKVYDKESFLKNLNSAVEALTKNILSAPMKTRWNACYACRYMFENKDFPIGFSDWNITLFKALLEELRECKNFKVRISAACALASSSLRSQYGDEKLFLHVWREVLVGLEKSEDLTDFTEFRHKDSLQFKTTLLLFHLLSLASIEDLKIMRQDVQKHKETFLTHCERILTIIKETEDCYQNQIENLSESISTDQKNKEELEQCCMKMRSNLVHLLDKRQGDIETIDLVKIALFFES